MNTETAAPKTDPVRMIVHDMRSDSDDVNPLIKESRLPLSNENGNFIVGKQKNGQLHNIVPGFSLPLKDRLLNNFDAYYEVRRKSYPFVMKFNDLPSAQVTLNFNVQIEFQLAVIDPVPIVADRTTSFLDCIRHNLKRNIDRVASRYEVRQIKEAQAELQKILDAFQCPPYLKWTCGLVKITPDDRTLKKLRELDEKQLDIAVIAANTERKVATELSGKITQSTVDNIEDHQLAKLSPLRSLTHQEEQP